MTLARVVRISMVLVLSLLLLLLLPSFVAVDAPWAHAYPREIKPGCRYEGRRYQEGTAVGTSEPCLRCRCTEGALRCRLRVCPRLPNPPPPGCHVRAPAENVCCAELVCGEPRDTENMLRRASVQTDIGAKDEKHTHQTEGCLHDGVRYGPGSAMMGSRRCEYCYCISGARRCIRPKCLLPLPGCAPLYAPHSCCPVAYNCTRCRMGERTYVEGEMVRDIEWKAACDNCFCAMGAIRCVPLACAPPLQGCSPIVREGQCCPSTYNCSGSIEVKATQNYASYAFISKDYAKFRKETNFLPAIDQSTSPPIEGRGHRVVEERASTGAIDLEEDSSVATYSTAWPSTADTDIMDNEILIGTVEYGSTLELSTNTEPVTLESTLASAKDADSVTNFCTACTTNALADTTIATTDDSPGTDDSTTLSPGWTTTTTTLPELTLDNGNDESEGAGDGDKNGSENENRNGAGVGPREEEEERADVIEKNKATTYPFAISTDAGDALAPAAGSPEKPTPAERTEAIGERPVTGPSSTILMPDDVLVMNVTVKTNVSVGHAQGVTISPIRSVIPPDVEAILNITQREKSEDYEYDYGEPALPPSLPNVRIIPFVAADALVKGKDAAPPSEAGYSLGSMIASSELRPTDASGFYDIATQENRFSPPAETEGGFVPREPLYFTDLNLEIGAGVTVIPAQITTPRRKNDDFSKCRFEGTEYRHGEILPSAGLCIICICYYGEIVCSSEKCSPLKIGCRRIDSELSCCGKIICVAADESPTVVLDRADGAAPSQRQPTASPDPFRDVIKTEPAPDLPSLIEDMMPYLVERGITTPKSTTFVLAKDSTSDQHSSVFDLAERVPPARAPFRHNEEMVDPPPLASEMKHAADRESPSTTRDSSTEAAALARDSELNRTADDTRGDLRRGNTTEHANRNASEGDPDGGLASQVESNGSSADNGKTVDDAEEEGIFSLDSVLELLFSSSNGTKSIESAVTPDVSAVGGGGVRGDPGALVVSSSTEGTEGLTEGLTERIEIVETSSKALDNEIPVSVGSLLKLAGCNIYGRMYRVGRIITELSSPCLECRCTEIGVQCKQLEC